MKTDLFVQIAIQINHMGTQREVMWKCTNCDTINQQDQENCVLCGLVCSEDERFLQLLPIEKLENGATLLVDFGVIPDIAMCRVSSLTILQILKDVKFDMDEVIESFELIQENEDVYYTDGSEYFWQFANENGSLMWLTERDYLGGITCTSVYDDISRRICAVDIRFLPVETILPDERKTTSCKLQLEFKDDWISTSRCILENQECKEEIRQNTLISTLITVKMTTLFDEYGNPMDLTNAQERV